MQKKIVDKLINECTETIEEVKLAKITVAKNKIFYWNYYLFCLLHMVFN